MLDVLIVSLILITLVLGSWQIITYAIRPLRHRTQINQLLFVAFVSIGFGILYDCFRTLSFMYLGDIWIDGGIWSYLDRIFYFFKFFLLLMGVSAILRVIFILNRQSGQKVAKETPIRYLYIILTIVLSILNYYTPEKIPSNPGIGFPQNFFTYQVNPYLYFLTLSFYLPLFFYMIIKIKAVLKVVKSRKLPNELIFFGIFVAALFNERNINLAAYLLFDPILINVLEFTFLAIVVASGFLLSLKYPNLVEDISAHFSMKSIYLLWKTGGIVMYKHNFGREESSTPDLLLMGGFLYAISCGLEETLKVSREIKTIKVGNTLLLFEYGKHIFGLGFVSENIHLLHQKLVRLIERFEKYYETDLEEWEGDLSKFDEDLIQSWVHEIFR